jgi:hypothetical protein
MLQTRLANIWRGELSLYEAAYALGGLSALFGSLAGDYFSISGHVTSTYD